jgi:hypothetical protein
MRSLLLLALLLIIIIVPADTHTVIQKLTNHFSITKIINFLKKQINFLLHVPRGATPARILLYAYGPTHEST